MAEDQVKTEAKSPSVFPSRSATYAKVAMHTDKIINKLVELLDSRTESIALGAANTLMSKILPDLRATELTGENQGPLRVIIVSENGAGNPIADQKLPEAAIDI